MGARASKQTFHCRSCNLFKPMDQLGKIVKGNNSKRCISCCEKAEAAKQLLRHGG